MARLLKSRLTLVLTLLLLLVLPALGQEIRETSFIAPGVELIQIYRQMNHGWVQFHVLEVDLSVEGVSIDALVPPRGVSNRTSTSQMAQAQGAVAGINGDFFHISSSGAPIGLTILSGQLAGGPVANNDWATVVVDHHQKADMERFIWLPRIEAPNGQSVMLNGYNQELAVGGTTLGYFDRLWAPVSPGNNSNWTRNASRVTEVVVNKEGRVLEVRQNRPGVTIPEGGYVLFGTGTRADYLAGFNVGESVRLNVVGSPSFDDYFAAVSGMPVLIENGRKAFLVRNDFNVTTHPRTAVGMSMDGKKVWMVVVDGRSALSAGISLFDLADFFVELGAFNALNLDGGGSSAMVARLPGESTVRAVNRPSDGGERVVPNGLGVFFHSTREGIVHLGLRPEIELPRTETRLNTAEHTIPLQGTRRLLLSAIDGRGQSVEVDPNRVKWTVEPAIGVVQDGVFTARESGKATIIAQLDGCEARLEIRVLGQAQSLEIHPSAISVGEGVRTNLSVETMDAQGFRAAVSPDDLQWEIRGGVGTLSGMRFTAARELAAGAILVKFGDLVGGSPVTVGSSTVILSHFEDTREWGHSVYPAEVPGRFAITDEEAYSGRRSGKLTYDFTTMTRTRAVYARNQTIRIEGRPLRLGLWVKGDGNGHWLRAQIRDAAGVMKPLTFAQEVNWTDWRYVTAEIPSDVVYPIQLETLYLVEARAEVQGRGAIYFDQLEVILPSPVDETDLVNLIPRAQDPANRPRPELSEEGFRFVVMGDTRLEAGREGATHARILAEMIEWVNREEIEFVIYTGDLIENNQPANYATGKAFLERLQAPYYMVAGNHEVAGNPSLANYTETFGDPVYAFDHGNARFLVLNTARGGLTSTDREQWNWLKAQLEKAQADDAVAHLFVAQHHPPVDHRPSASHGFSDRREGVLLEQTLADFREASQKTTWLFAGHLHGFMRWIRNGLNVVVAAGAGAPLYLPADDGGFFHYLVVSVDGQEVSYEVVPLLTHIDLHPVGSVKVGESVKVKATGVQPYGTVQFPLAYPATVRWSVSDQEIASINGQGVLTAHSQGTVLVTVRAGEVESSIQVHVEE